MFYSKVYIVMEIITLMYPLSVAGNNNNSEAQIDSKSEQWFGATVRSSGEDGVILVSNLFVLMLFASVAAGSSKF